MIIIHQYINQQSLSYKQLEKGAFLVVTQVKETTTYINDLGFVKHVTKMEKMALIAYMTMIV